MKIFLIFSIFVMLVIGYLTLEIRTDQNVPNPVDPTVELRKDIQTLASAIKFQQSEIRMLKRKLEKRR